jgi:hypothetical protein
MLFSPLSIKLAARFKTSVCDRSLVGIEGFESLLKYGCLPLVSVGVVSVRSGWSLVQRSSIECGVSECDREASIMMGPWPTGAVAPCTQENELSELLRLCRVGGESVDEHRALLEWYWQKKVGVEENLPWHNFVHPTPHMYLPGIEHEPPRKAACDSSAWAEASVWTLTL